MELNRTSRQPKNTAARREELLAVALELFNAKGTAPVSTNHIAAAAGISAGNVYYWFPNKRAIIRALFEQWRDASAIGPVAVNQPSDILVLLAATVRRQVSVTERFTVFARELVPLLHADDVLTTMYRENYVTRIDQFVSLVEVLVDAGLVNRPEPPADIRSLVEVTWVATEYTPSFLAAVGARPDLDEVVRIISAPLFAQLTPAGRAALEAADRRQEE